MSKKIVVLTGSPRRGGNSFAMTDAFIRQAQAKANEILSTSQLQARELKKATSDYVDSVLKSTEEQVAKSLAELRSKRQAIKAAKIS